ncbi:hypothetical protein DWZ32_04805 [Bacteroides intestinalis]|uniref:DUF4906 domain-containing protein n=2 Tax=Bacteroides intestinalis TaxID=329854 RepID=A0AB37MCA3_9BACE|nr:hypothetical protein DWZ32_04805 [Bacteroides intestinalis]
MLMKKICLLLVGLLAMFSCEQENLEGIVQSGAEQVQTRATTSSIADFNPIYELDGIPVNILNVGNTSRRYLSCAPSGSEMSLYTKDDGSLRQRWYITFNNIASVGGNESYNSSYNSPFELVVVGFNYPANITDPKLVIVAENDNPLLTPTFYSFVSARGGYYNIRAADKSMQIPMNFQYLQSDSRSGTALKNKSAASSDLALWEVVPVGEYELVDLEYVYTSVDNFNPTEVICDRDTYENPSSSVVTWNYTVTTKYTESSNFSKTEGVSVSISNGLSVGLPSVAGSPSIGINTTMQQQTSKSWTYGNSDSKEFITTRTGNIPVQPHTTMRLEASVFMYEGTVTYVATLRKIGDTKTFRVKGKWEGSCFSEFSAKTYDVVTGRLLNTYTLEK